MSLCVNIKGARAGAAARPVFGARPLAPRRISVARAQTPAAPAPVAAPPSKTVAARQLLDDLAAGGLSPCRFVVVGSGAILESVGEWSPVRYAERSTGAIATISNQDKVSPFPRAPPPGHRRTKAAAVRRGRSTRGRHAAGGGGGG